MNLQLKESKQTLRSFMREHYTDERLVWLLAHARSGNLAFFSCCCFIGIPTADHALRGEGGFSTVPHYITAKMLAGSTEAEYSYCVLGIDDALRVRRLIPMILAEMRRRERVRAAEQKRFETVAV